MAGDKRLDWFLFEAQQRGFIHREIREGTKELLKIEMEIEQILYETLLERLGKLPARHPGTGTPIGRSPNP